MKIGLVYDAVYPWVKGGGEKHLWETAVALRRRGHEVHCFGMKYWPGPKTIEREGIVLHGVCRARPLYRRDGERSRTQPIIFAIGLLRTLLSQPTERLDVIDSIAFPYFSIFAIQLWRSLTGARTLWVVTWLEVWGKDYWESYLGSKTAGRLAFWLEKAAARLGDQHLCLSKVQAKRLRELLGTTPTDLDVIPRGLELDKLPPTQAVTSPNLIYCGRLVANKNVGVVLHALPLIRQNVPQTRLTILGEGPELSKLKELTAELKLDAAIEFLPFTSDHQTAWQQIAKASVLMQPSTREGLSMIVLEAQALGVPVIAARHPESAVSDIIVNGETGMLIEEWNDPAAWASVATRLLRDAELMERLTRNARTSVKAFDLESSIVPRLEAIYRGLIFEA